MDSAVHRVGCGFVFFFKDFLYRSMEYIYQELFVCCIRYCMYCVGDCLLGDLLL